MLGGYAKRSQSSTVFLDASKEQILTAPTSSVPTTSSNPTGTRNIHRPSVHQNARGKIPDKTATTGTSDKCCGNSTVLRSVSSAKATKRSFPLCSAGPTRYAWLTEHASDDESLTATVLPPYSSDMLQSSDLPLNSRASLEMLTRSLQAVGRVPSFDRPNTGRRRLRTSSASSTLTAHKRSLSVQSLASTTSSADSGIVGMKFVNLIDSSMYYHNLQTIPFHFSVDMSEMASHRVRYPSGSSHCRTSSVTSLTHHGGRPKSASVIVSKEKPYVSPYAQSGRTA